MAATQGSSDMPKNVPSAFAQFLHQFPDKKLKNMQDAYLAGDDLAPYVETKMLRTILGGSSEGGGAKQNSAHAQALGHLTIALGWSLAAPEILKPPQTNGANSVGGGATGQRFGSFYSREQVAAAGPLDNVLQADCCELVGWMKDWKGSSEHQEKIKTSISIPVEELACSKHGVSIIGHADFGIKRVGWPSSNVPAVPYDRPVPQYFRTLVVLNEGPQPVVLLDVCGVPSIDKTFKLHDDSRLAHHYDIEQNQKAVHEGSSGVTIRAGVQYQVTVELRCNQQDIAWHQQWLLFIFGSGNALDKSNQNIFVIGRRVSALIGHNIQDVQRCLSTEAKPFYPAYLRSLFDREPLNFDAAGAQSSVKSDTRDSNLRDWRMQLPAFRQTYLLSLWPWQIHRLEEVLHGRPLLSPPSSPRRPCDCSVKQIRKFARLLALEEVAMERDIKEYDMFNVQLVFRDSFNFILEVPGLPENRPSVFVDDFVYLRWERKPQMECAAKVIAVEYQPKPRLILQLPRHFLGSCPVHPAPILVHVRFTFDRLVLSRMYAALLKVATSTAKLLPCICRKGFMGESSSQTRAPPNKPKNGIRSKLPATISDVGLERPDMINKFLNMEQRKAVENIANHVPGSGPYVILGPPGTGKTVTMVECVLQVLARNPSARLCVCAPSNYAADILCSGIAAGGFNDSSLMWRMNDPRRSMASIKVDVLPFCNFKVLSRGGDETLNFKVIVCTCGSAGMLDEDPLSRRIGSFTHILIDEAGQALIPEALIPFSLGNPNTCYVLCGDPKQLGPVVHSKLAAENGLDDTLIGRFQSTAEDNFMPKGAISSVLTKLVRNYRANGKLLELPSRLFYNNELIASASESQIAPPRDWDELKGRDFPMLFYGVKGQQMREGESPSYFNPVEAGKVADLITGLISKTQITAGDIGVMAPYRRQVQKLRLVLRSRRLGAVRVGTVDDYQGQEERVVFISTVLTRPESLRQVKSAEKTRQIGFLSNAKRFNVAITRAKAMLVVVGHPLVLAQDENWSELLRYCLARDAFRGYGSEFVVPAISSKAESLPSHSAFADDGSEVDPEEEDDDRSRLEAQETAKAIEKMAELSLLGMGDVDRLYPVNLDSMYSAFSEETEWRIQL
ncbi:unnamed protein product [Calypogeia fissa]